MVQKEYIDALSERPGADREFGITDHRREVGREQAPCRVHLLNSLIAQWTRIQLALEYA